MIGVTVLTGFLGSGKTTLLARLLKNPALARTAVIINEFGAVGIDHDLVEAGEESFVELETGCLCCRVRGDLEATLADLMARRAAGTVPEFERIVIETSGLADPAPVLQALMLESARNGAVALGRVVALVDAVTGPALLERELQAARQVAAADLLVVTKTDLLGMPPESLQAQLRRLNPGAKVLLASFGAIDPDVLLEPLALRSPDWLESIGRGPDAPQMFAERPGGRAHPLMPGGHDQRIKFEIIRRNAPIRAATLPLFLEALADQCGGDLLRLKGLVAVTECPEKPAVIHGVQHLFHAPIWLDRWPSTDRTTRIAMIGRGLCRIWAERLLDALDAEVGEVDRSGPNA